MTQERMKVWPREGLLIRDEYSMQHIQPGDEIVVTRTVRKHLANGDLLDKAPKPNTRKNALRETREAFPDQRRGAEGVTAPSDEGQQVVFESEEQRNAIGGNHEFNEKGEG